MTIRQRLYFSNVLMIVMPIVLTAIVLGGVFFIFSETLGSDFITQWQENKGYAQEYERLEDLQESFDSKPPTEVQLMTALDRLAAENPRHAYSLFLYDKEHTLVTHEGTFK